MTRDVLLRHHLSCRAVTGDVPGKEQRTSHKTRKTACDNCAELQVECSGKPRCQRCTNFGLECRNSVQSQKSRGKKQAAASPNRSCSDWEKEAQGQSPSANVAPSRQSRESDKVLADRTAVGARLNFNDSQRDDEDVWEDDWIFPDTTSTRPTELNRRMSDIAHVRPEHDADLQNRRQTQSGKVGNKRGRYVSKAW